MRVLNSRVFAGVGGKFNDDMYNDVPVYDDSHEDVVWQGKTGAHTAKASAPTAPAPSALTPPPSTSTTTISAVPRAPPPGRTILTTGREPGIDFRPARTKSRPLFYVGDQSDYVYSDSKKGPPPGRPAAPKPVFGAKGSAGPGQAIAKFTFDADQPGDLGFKKGSST